MEGWNRVMAGVAGQQQHQQQPYRNQQQQQQPFNNQYGAQNGPRMIQQPQQNPQQQQQQFQQQFRPNQPNQPWQQQQGINQGNFGPQPNMVRTRGPIYQNSDNMSSGYSQGYNGHLTIQQPAVNYPSSFPSHPPGPGPGPGPGLGPGPGPGFHPSDPIPIPQAQYSTVQPQPVLQPVPAAGQYVAQAGQPQYQYIQGQPGQPGPVMVALPGQPGLQPSLPNPNQTFTVYPQTVTASQNSYLQPGAGGPGGPGGGVVLAQPGQQVLVAGPTPAPPPVQVIYSGGGEGVTAPTPAPHFSAPTPAPLVVNTLPAPAPTAPTSQNYTFDPSGLTPAQQLAYAQAQQQHQQQHLKKMRQRLPHVSGRELQALHKQIKDLQHKQHLQTLQTLRLAQVQEKQAFKYLDSALKTRQTLPKNTYHRVGFHLKVHNLIRSVILNHSTISVSYLSIILRNPR